MTLNMTSKMWGISTTRLKMLIEDKSIPLIDGEIPSNIKGIVLVDRRYSAINNLDFDDVILLFLILIRCHCYFNAKLLNLAEDDFDTYVKYLLNENLISKEDNFNYELTSIGEERYYEVRNNRPKFIRMLLGSVKINRVIIDRMEKYF